ncbi:hypothetical protein CPB86DRAFT_704957 [Serendipita vermifera]|nr:hypothetical protein CPB86DRAFT_704957 [Serendipita vermifera]
MKIQTLRLRSDIFASDLVQFLKSMEHLNTLTLDGLVQNDQLGVITCPSVKVLVAEDQEILRYVSMPNLTSLTFRDRSEMDYITKEAPVNTLERSFAGHVQSLSLVTTLAETVIVDDSEFTQLSTLRWLNRYEGYCYPHCSFPELIKISFDDGLAELGASYFCQLLLRYPRMCPRLQTISIQGYPEWDMLLYMLLRRNVYRIQDGISRITSIGLPGYPAPCILVPLSTLLSGKIPLEMPSLEELSFVETFFDPAVPGCADCINCRLACSKAADLSDSEESSSEFMLTLERSSGSMLPGSDPPLPNHLQIWVDSWQERIGEWINKGSEWRETHCARHDYSRLVVIDGHTLDGPYAPFSQREAEPIIGVGIDSRELQYPIS